MKKGSGYSVPLESRSRTLRQQLLQELANYGANEYASNNLPEEYSSSVMDQLSAELAAIYDACAPSTFRLRMFGDGGDAQGLGSAFFITLDGKDYVVTAAHCVAPKIVAFCPGLSDAKFDCELVAVHPSADVAIYRILNSPDVPRLELAPELENGFAVKQQQGLVAIGNPLGIGGDTTNPHAAYGQVTDLHEPGALDPSINQILIGFNATIAAGNSGGPSFNSRAQVVGVNVMGVPGTELFFATPTSYIRELATAAKAKSAALDFGKFMLVDTPNGVEAIEKRPKTTCVANHAWQKTRIKAKLEGKELKRFTFSPDAVGGCSSLTFARTSMTAKVVRVDNTEINSTVDLQAYFQPKNPNGLWQQKKGIGSTLTFETVKGNVFKVKVTS